MLLIVNYKSVSVQFILGAFENITVYIINREYKSTRNQKKSFIRKKLYNEVDDDR